MSHSKLSKLLLTHQPTNPTLSYVEGIKVSKKCKEIVSQGGGSTIDVGKWLARKYKLKHTVIPTTAGTGSEMTKYCVLMVDGKKTTFTDHAFIPDSYVLDPTLVVSLPVEQTIACGFDALAQCLESMWSVNATTNSQLYSCLGMELVFQNLHKTIENPENLQARMNMLIAANMSGRAINITRTNVCHAISYPLTAWYNIPHGIACALTLPYFTQKALGLKIGDFVRQFMPVLPLIDIGKVVDEVMISPKLKDCPFEVTREDIWKSISQ